MELDGKVCVITGANTGIGRVTATEIAKRGARVIVATRSEEKTQGVLEDIARAGGKGEWVALDLGDLASVRRATDEIQKRVERIDILVANAGVGGARGTTKDGFEVHFGTNHLGHFLFVTRLLPLLEKAAPSRVVVVSSKAHYGAKRIDWDALREPPSLTGLDEYGVSKACNVLFVRELARREKDKGVHAYAVHPGVVASDIWRRIPALIRPLATMWMRTTEQGAESSLHCALSEEAASETGLYYDADSKPKPPSKLAQDDALAAELWRKSEEWTS